MDKIDPDLENIKLLWPYLPWYLKVKILYMARYFMICNRIDKFWGKVNLTWLRIMTWKPEPKK
jgi:hypothetical protein